MYQVLSALINQIKFIYHTNYIGTHSSPLKEKMVHNGTKFGEPDALTGLEEVL